MSDASLKKSPHHLFKKSMAISYGLLLIGFVFLGWLIYKLGVHNIGQNLKSLGWNFFTALLPSLFSYILHTQAWLEFLKESPFEFPFMNFSN
jgi:hypothetical protein